MSFTESAVMWTGRLWSYGPGSTSGLNRRAFTIHNVVVALDNLSLQNACTYRVGGGGHRHLSVRNEDPREGASGTGLSDLKRALWTAEVTAAFSARGCGWASGGGEEEEAGLGIGTRHLWSASNPLIL